MNWEIGILYFFGGTGNFTQVIDPNGQKTAHSLRHFFGTEQMQHTGRIEEVADDMGHHSTENTKRYARKAREERRAKRAVDFFEGKI